MWENDRKAEDGHSDLSGDAAFRCPHCNQVWFSWINGWRKKARNGGLGLNLSFKPKGSGVSRDDSEPVAF
jgi:hypothetical protein